MGKKPSIEEVAAQWIELKAKKIELEKQYDELRGILEPYLAEQPEKSAELAGWKFSLVESSRESFRLSEAKKKIDGRVLAPYITTTEVSQIRTAWRGGEEAA